MALWSSYGIMTDMGVKQRDRRQKSLAVMVIADADCYDDSRMLALICCKDNNSMSEFEEQLRLNLRFRDLQTTHLLPISKTAPTTLSTAFLLRTVKTFLQQHHISVAHFLAISIESKGVRQNLFKLKRKGTGITLTPDKGHFELNVIIEQGSSQPSPLLAFQQKQESYLRLKDSISQTIEGSGQQEVRRSSNSRPIDIAYFFADPLVKMHVKSGTKLEIVPTQSEVSYQVEYDQFIDIVQKEQFRRNFRIEMMAATQTNIKNTLIEGTSILHFSCHGDEQEQLHIEHEKKIGQLVKLKSSTFMELLDAGTLPKVAIFNACFSFELAKRVSAQKNIVTIGYKGKANDKVCEQFTKNFYVGLFRDNKSVRQLFHEIKAAISQEKPEEGAKLHIFPEEEEESTSLVEEPAESNLQFRKRWRVLESLRENDCLGVKQEMYKIIKTLINEERMSCIFLEGSRGTGKTNLIQKIRIYTINRKLFTDDLAIDLRVAGHRLETMLALRLSAERKVLAFRSQVEGKERLGQQGVVNSLIIIDHAQKLLRYQYRQLRKYIEKQLKDRLRYGEIVVVCRRDEPLCKQSKIEYAHENRILKEEKDIENIKEFDFFIQRYYSKEFLQKLRQLRRNKNCKFIQLIKALKMSKSKQLADIEKHLGNLSSKVETKILDFDFQKQLKVLQQTAAGLLQDINVQIAEHHHFYLSTILSKIALKEHTLRDKLHSSSGRQNKDASVIQLVRTFKVFFKRSLVQQPGEVAGQFGRLAQLSLDIAGLCYLSKCYLEAHLLSCQTLYVMASVCLTTPQLRLSKTASHGQEEDLSSSQVEDVDFDERMERSLRHYRLKVLLTLYTFYTQREHELQVKERSREKREGVAEDSEEFHHKAEIVMDELFQLVQRRSSERESESRATFLKRFKELNHIVQHLRFSAEENTLKMSQQLEPDPQPPTEQINKLHESISLYWQLLLEVLGTNREAGEAVLSRDSEAVLKLIAIRLIKPSQKVLAQLKAQNPSSFTREIEAYVELYVKIMQYIMDSRLFLQPIKKGQQSSRITQERQRQEREERQREGGEEDYLVWRYPQVASIKPLFKQYYREFVRVYFELSKLSQALSKNYSVRIFNELLGLCDHPRVKMVSEKKAIESHKEAQFLNNYSCETLVALPLLDSEEDFKYLKGKRINVKRFEGHIRKFQESFFNSLERQIRHDFSVLSRQFFTKKPKQSKCLIQLLVVNCSEEVVECESKLATTQTIKISDIFTVPSAPVIILFGVNVKYLVSPFREKCKGSFVISLNLQEADTPSEVQLERVAERGEEKLRKGEKEGRLRRLQEYGGRLQMAHSILQYFYTSFCKHFFTVEYTHFSEQVRSSFHFALAQTHLKMRIRYEPSPSFGFVDDMLREIEISTSVETDHLLKTKLAYHFMFRSVKVEELMKFISLIAQSKEQADRDKQTKRERDREREKKETGIRPEMGCNNQIVEVLSQMQEHKRKLNVVVLYKSRDMLELFRETFTRKIQKYGQYELEEEPRLPQWEDMNRTSTASSPGLKSKTFDEQTEQEKPRIQMFDGLEEEDFRRQAQECGQREVRVFFTQKAYRVSPPGTLEVALEERFQSQRWLYELFFLECLKERPLASLETLRKVLGKYEGASLRDVREGVRAAKEKRHQ